MSSPDAAPALKALAGVTTATLTTILLKKGLRNVWIRGAFPIAPGTPRVAGRAFTDAIHPGARGSGDAGIVEHRRSRRARRLKTMPAGCIAVVDANWRHGRGLLGRHPVRAHGQAWRRRRSSATASFAMSPA